MSSFLLPDPKIETAIRAKGEQLFALMDQQPPPALFSKKGAYARLNQIGTRFPAPPARFTAADGTNQSGRHMYAYDPDGRMIEIMQLDSRK